MTADAQRKLRSLGKALEERPGLSLEIEGWADPDRDRDGLRRFLVERKLKAQKVAELVAQGAAVASPDQVQIDQTVTDEDLRALALRRASALEGGLARNAPSATGRLFLVAPRVAADGSHVELKLKKD